MKKSGKLKQFKKQLPLQMFVLLGMLFLLIFSFIPMFGLLMAFKDYSIIDGIPGIFTSEWVGLKYFKEFISDYAFPRLIRNTVAISALKLIFTFPLPILFAIILNELHHIRYKKLVQTCSYLPHFISWVVVASLTKIFLERGGIVNDLLLDIGLIDKPIAFLTNSSLYWGLAVFLDIWKETGWWTIIFLAAITGVNSELYEAAAIDGASRLQKIRYITLSLIKPTIVTVLIMALGSLFSGGLGGSNFDQAYMIGNDMNLETSQILQTYIYEVGLSKGRFAYATAAGLFQSMISLILVFTSNFFAKKISGSSLF